MDKAITWLKGYGYLLNPYKICQTIENIEGSISKVCEALEKEDRTITLLEDQLREQREETDKYIHNHTYAIGYAHILTHSHNYIHIHKNTHTTYTRTHTTYNHTHIHANIHTQTHTHTHTHTIHTRTHHCRPSVRPVPHAALRASSCTVRNWFRKNNSSSASSSGSPSSKTPPCHCALTT